jgi:hypothetical protein
LYLFNTRGELLAFGRSNYHIHSRDASTLLLQLFWRAQEEIGAMSSAFEEFARETIDELLKKLPAEKRIELLKGLSPQQRLEGLTPEQRVQGLSAEELLELAKRLKGNGAAEKP